MADVDVLITMAEKKEIETLLDLVEQYYEFDHIGFSRESSRSSLSLLLSDSSLGRALLFRAGGQVIGYGILTFGFDHEFGGRIAVLTDFYFKEPYRGRGYGNKILRQIEEKCLDLGIVALELQVSSENKSAVKLYEKMGFEAFDRIPMAKRLAGHSKFGGSRRGG